MPNESPDFDLRPQDIDRILTDWQDEAYLQHMAGREAAHESDRITERMFEESDRLKREREAGAPTKIPIRLVTPPEAQAANQARQEAFDRAWEVEDSKSIPQLAPQVTEKVLAEGYTPLPGLEDSDPEIEKISARARAADANKLHKDRKKSKRKPRRGYALKETGPSDKAKGEI